MSSFLTFFLKIIDLKGLISIFVTLGSFVYLSGIQIGIVLVLIVIIHEVGHAIALHKMNYPMPKIFLIPFFGGVAVHSGENIKPIDSAWFALGGPAFGALIATAGFIVFLITKDKFWFYFALFGFVVNLINLVPLSILDGGKIVSLLDKRLYFVGLILGIIALIKFQSIFITIFIILTIVQIFKLYKEDENITACINCGQKNRVQDYADVDAIAKCGKCKFELNASKVQKFYLAMSYFGLIVFQIIMIINVMPYKT